MVHGIDDVTAMKLDARPALYPEATKFKIGLTKRPLVQGEHSIQNSCARLEAEETVVSDRSRRKLSVIDVLV